LALRKLGLVYGFEKLWCVELKAVYLLAQRGDLLVNDFEGFRRVLAVLDLDLNQKTPLLAFLCKFFGLL
jgi:hypothetical protein